MGISNPYTFIVAIERELAILVAGTISKEDAELVMEESGLTSFEITIYAESADKAIELFQAMAKKLS